MAFRKRLDRTALTILMPVALSAAPVLLATTANAQTAIADLRILSPRAGDTLDSTSFALDVSFRSRARAITTAELWVDGTRWIHRDLDAPQLKNVLSFDVDATTLSEGSHTFLIRVFDAAGGTAEKTVTLQLVGRENTAAKTSSAGPEIKFVTPGNDQRISGIVEMQLDARPRGGVNPYVTFYIDRQFKTLKNYPPYSFNWDTTTVENGYHTIEAMGYLDTNNAATTRKLRVYVDNPGGNTPVKNDIPDLSREQMQTPVTSVSGAVRPMTIPIRRSTGITAHSAAALVTSGLGAMHTDLTPDVKSEIRSLTSKVKAGLTPITLTELPDKSPVSRTVPRLARPTSTLALKTAAAIANTAEGMENAAAHLSRPATVTTTLTRLNEAALHLPAKLAPPTQTLAKPTAAPQMAKPVSKIAPAMESDAIKDIVQGISAAKPTAPRVPLSPALTARVSLATPVQQSIVPVAVTHVSKAAPRPAPQILSTLTAVTETKAIQVAFNGSPISFDVVPHLEKGVAMAPFRQIFERTGGQVSWIPGTHSLRAMGADREVIISVGKNTATINGEVRAMEHEAIIEKGRLLVPVSFIKESLNVDMDFSPATGQLQIRSKN